MNYPYGLQPRTFQLSKREWAAPGVKVSTVGPTSARALALTDGTSHADTVPHRGRTQIVPQPPSTSPQKRGAPRRSFMSVTDWSVSAEDGTNANNLYKSRKLHHLPPMTSPRTHRSSAVRARSSAVRARSLIRANQQAATHYEQALEAAERQTLEHDELRQRRQLDTWQQAELAELNEPSPPSAELERGEREVIEDRPFHTLYSEEFDAGRPLPPDTDAEPRDRYPEEAHEDASRTPTPPPLPTLCECHQWQDVTDCRRQIAHDLVEDLLSYWDAEAEVVDDVCEPASGEGAPRQATTTTTDCLCTTTSDIDECRHHQAADLVALILAGVVADTVPPQEATSDALLELRRHEAEVLVDEVLASVPVETPCTCKSATDVQNCRQVFLSALVEDVLADYV